MNKLFRIWETLARLLKKPPTQAGRRIQLSPFFKNIFSEDEDENIFRLRKFYHPTIYYNRNQQFQQLQHQNQLNEDTQGIATYAQKQYRDKSFQQITTGDYGLQENFFHSIQLNREGADVQYFTFDDVESVQSRFEDNAYNFDLEDSLMIQR